MTTNRGLTPYEERLQAMSDAELSDQVRLHFLAMAGLRDDSTRATHDLALIRVNAECNRRGKPELWLAGYEAYKAEVDAAAEANRQAAEQLKRKEN